MKTPLVTREGYEKLKQELNYLWREERPEDDKKGDLGRRVWATAAKMLTISIIKSVCVKSTVACAISLNAWKISKSSITPLSRKAKSFLARGWRLKTTMA